MQDLALSQRGLTPLQDLLRLLSGGLIAVVVTFCLYWLMASLVAMASMPILATGEVKVNPFISSHQTTGLHLVGNVVGGGYHWHHVGVGR